MEDFCRWGGLTKKCCPGGVGCKILEKRARKSTQVVFNYLRLCLPRACVQLRSHAVACAQFDQGQICMQVDARFSLSGHPMRVAEVGPLVYFKVNVHTANPTTDIEVALLQLIHSRPFLFRIKYNYLSALTSFVKNQVLDQFSLHSSRPQ